MELKFFRNERYERWDRADAVDNFQERLQPYFNQSVSHYYHSVSPQYPNHLSFNTWFLWTVQMILRRGGSGAMASVLGVGKCWHHFCSESWLFIHEASQDQFVAGYEFWLFHCFRMVHLKLTIVIINIVMILMPMFHYFCGGSLPRQFTFDFAGVASSGPGLRFHPARPREARLERA